MNVRISSGQFFASSNQEVVRVISYKAPHVRYAQASYGGTVCKTTDRVFLENYRPIDEERATQLLRGPGQPPLPKVTAIPEGAAEELWFGADAHLRRLALIAENQKPVNYRTTADFTDLELEKLVATRVFQSIDPHRVFRYADNLNDAHRVIEHMRKLHFVVRLDNGLDGTWEATFYKNAETAHGPNDQFYAPEGTLARAICVSALKAVSAPEMEGANE